MSLRVVAVLALEPVSLFEFGVPAEIFGIDRTDDDCPAFEFRVCAQDPTRPLAVKVTSPMGLIPTHGLDGLIDADLVVIGAATTLATQEPVVAALRAAYAAGAILLSLCSGAFALADTGLLDGRRCATHWRYCDELARRHPEITVDGDSLFVDEGRLITSAGTASAIDTCLHLVRRELGAAVATRIARRMVVPPQREGGQRQYVDAPVPHTGADSLAPLLEWVLDHLETPHTAATLAARAHLSGRTFARRFVAETGTTPHRWLIQQRVLAARELLEAGHDPIEQIAAAVGFGSAVVLRTHFRAIVGTSPTTYRARFGHRTAG